MHRLLILTFIFIGACAQKQPLGVLLFDEYFEVYPIELNERSLQSIPELVPAYEAYQKGDYATVVEVAGDFTRNVQMLPLPMMALSMGYMKIDSLEQADETLKILEAHPDIGDESSWFRALIAVKQGQFEKAKGLFGEAKRMYDPVLIEKSERILLELP